MPPDPVDHLLSVHGVSVRFGGLAALDDVRIDVPAGTVAGLIGPNGAGKTTLFNVVSGLLRPDSGRIEWKGRTLRRHRPHDLAGLGIARTFQGLNLFGGLPVLDNVMVGAERFARGGAVSMLTGLGAHGRDERLMRDRAMAVLEEFGIAGTARSLPGTLPFGLQKRVALARAVVAEPELLLLDEPAAGISADDIGALAELIGRLGERMGVLLVEHHVDLVMQVCERITVLDFGRVICAGPPEAVRADPGVAEAYLGTGEEAADDA
ncbi:amino acid/amide ABC transporter ATP-binding protein 1 (HAAT family) [Murinocardiopsis flavida]|uniref:Amino acid/amide ABC transporter ATP-binding protein 1 (HAAT family) n=1 Tax=Murinocardiopsis flavida TaxID=645275 RepID=A0A2P8DLN4_9ACTN|nr:ABC transporter ATP-binding protein [Murinocardiopsis flavida]PSK98139.1 amino acid/amide ABC transporter ATP-binding protein 1 (HAAT family) [Murinocardiopsis flavida]